MCKLYKNQLVFDAVANGLGFQFTVSNCCVHGTDQDKINPLPINLETTNFDEVSLGEIIVQACRNNMKNVCALCPLNDNDSSEGLIDRIMFTMKYGTCNLKCPYCFSRPFWRHPLFNHYDKLFKYISAMHAAGQFSENLEFVFSSGEFSINPRQWGFYAKLKEYFPNARFSFYTNATIFNGIISNELQRGGTIITNIPHVDCDEYQYITLSQIPIDHVFENLVTYRNVIIKFGQSPHHLELNLFASKLIDTSIIDQFIDKVCECNLQDCNIGMVPSNGKFSHTTHLYNHIISYFNNKFFSKTGVPVFSKLL